MKLDDEEREVRCAECFGYLWSVSVYDGQPEQIPCPYQRDPLNECTGRPKRKQAAERGTEE